MGIQEPAAGPSAAMLYPCPAQVQVPARVGFRAAFTGNWLVYWGFRAMFESCCAHLPPLAGDRELWRMSAAHDAAVTVRDKEAAGCPTRPKGTW